MTTPQDVANMVAYLSSEAADGMTGQNITVDGGFNHELIYNWSSYLRIEIK